MTNRTSLTFVSITRSLLVPYRPPLIGLSLDASLPPDEEQKKEADLKARQLIFEMDMQMWKVSR